MIGAPGGTGLGTGGLIEMIGTTSVPGSAGPGLSGIASIATTDRDSGGNAQKLARP